MQVDLEPTTEAEVTERRVILMHQLQEARQANRVQVTCPCGCTIAINYAFRCLSCGLWFCRPCAMRHMGATVVDGRIVFNREDAA